MNINLTIFVQLTFFGVFVWFCMKYIWPPVMSALEARRNKIAEGLTAAEEARVSLAKAQTQSQDLTQEARQKSLEIIHEAEARAKKLLATAKDEAKTEGDKQLADAKSEIEQEIQRAKEGLRHQLSDLVLNGATQVIGSEIDAKKHAKLIDELAEQL